MNEGLELEIYPYSDPKAAKPKWVIPYRKNPTGLEEMKANGGGSFWLAKTDPKVAQDPDLLDSRNVCKIRANGEVVSGFILGNRESTIISSGERSEQGWQINGGGLKTWFEDATVKPFGGLKPESADSRYFNFASTERGSWYNSSEWVNPTFLGPIITGGHASWYNAQAPAKWPENMRHAQWFWGSPLQDTMPFEPIYVRWEFSVATPGLYALYLAVDDQFIVYLNGEQIAKSSEKTSSWTESHRIELSLPSGQNTIAFIAQNRNAPGYYGPAGMTFALSQIGYDGVENYIGVSNGNDGVIKVCPYPTQVPGWTVGEVLLTLLNEAKTRGVLFPNYLTPTFTATLDSYNQPWTDKAEWSFSVGEQYSSVISKIEELYDIWIDPDTYELHMAPNRGISHTLSSSRPIKFYLGKHLREAKTQAKGKIKNALDVKTNEGWAQAVDTGTSIGKYGRLESSMEMKTDKAFAGKVADLVFNQRAQEEEGASYALTPDENIPFTHFGVGDWVLAPNERGETVPRRVMSIAVEELSGGQIGYTIEFDTIFRENEDRMNRVLNKLGGGGVGGGLSSGGGIVPGGGGGGIELPPTNTPPVRIPKAPTGLSVDSEGYWSGNGVTPYSEVTVTWNPVTQNTDNSELIPERYELWGQDNSTPEEGWQFLGQYTTTTAKLTQYIPGTVWQFKVRAVNIDSTSGAFSAVVTETMIGPVEPLPAPDQPTLTSEMGLLNVSWNGLLGGQAPAPQFRYVYAERSRADLNSWARVGSVFNRDTRQVSIAGLDVGTSYKIRLTAVDGANIKSAPSTSSDPVTITGINLGELNQEVTDAIEAAKQAGLRAREQINMLNDNGFEAGSSTPYWSLGVGASYSTQRPFRGTNHLRVNSSGVVKDVLWYNTIFECSPGDAFYFRAYVMALNTAAVNLTNGLSIQIEYGPTPTLGTIANVGSSGTLLLTDYLDIAGNWEAPDDVKYFRPKVTITNPASSTAVWYIDETRMYRMTGTDELVNGSITTDKLVADSITSVQIIAEAIMTEHLQSGSVVTEKLATNSVTANKISAGAIEANHIKAGAIQTNHLSPSVGNDLNLSANNSIVLIAGQASEAKDTADSNAENLSQMQTYYTYGAGGAIISSPGDVFSLALRNDKIEMLENGNTVSYWNSGTLYVSQFVGERVTLANHQLEAFGDGTIVRAL